MVFSLDALIGRTGFEAKRNLDLVGRCRRADYLADREREENDRVIGIASDGPKWGRVRVQRRSAHQAEGSHARLGQGGSFFAWLVAQWRSVSRFRPMTVRLELGQDSVVSGIARSGTGSASTTRRTG
jgi:hypothetical protein